MDVHVKVKKPLARRCRCGMTFDASGCLMQVTPEEYAALKADPWLDVAIMDPEDTELSPTRSPLPPCRHRRLPRRKAPRAPPPGKRRPPPSPQPTRPRAPMPDAFPASYASPADMTARFGLQELIGLAPLPEKRCPGRLRPARVRG